MSTERRLRDLEEAVEQLQQRVPQQTTWGNRTRFGKGDWLGENKLHFGFSTLLSGSGAGDGPTGPSSFPTDAPIVAIEFESPLPGKPTMLIRSAIDSDATPTGYIDMVAKDADGDEGALLALSAGETAAQNIAAIIANAADGTFRASAEANGSGRLELTGLPTFKKGSEVTIASGVASISAGFHAIDTESDAASDDLDTINSATGYSHAAGTLFAFHPANAGRTIVAKDGTGNLSIAGDFAMDDQEDTLLLVSNGANGWYELARSNSSASIETITSSDTLDAGNYVVLVNATSGAVTVTLPAVAANTGRIYYIKKIDSSANAVTIDGNASETIDDSTTRILSSQYDSVTIACDGTEWWIL